MCTRLWLPKKKKKKYILKIIKIIKKTGTRVNSYIEPHKIDVLTIVTYLYVWSRIYNVRLF
jgi:hypothetical protein